MSWNGVKRWIAVGIGVAATAACGGAPSGESDRPAPAAPSAGAAQETAPSAGDWEDSFSINRATLATSGRNDYLVLEPGWQVVMREDDEEVTITVTNETETVDGAVTRVVEERETAGGRLVEVSRNFLAIDPATRDVFYFGEDVEKYRDGRPYQAADAWRAGVNDARAGLLMPGTATVGRRHYQEVAPGVAMDRAEIVSVSDTVTTPAGTFEGCLRVIETTPIERGESPKLYARGIGMIGDGGLRLVRYGPRAGR